MVIRRALCQALVQRWCSDDALMESEAASREEAMVHWKHCALGSTFDASIEFFKGKTRKQNLPPFGQ